VVHLVQPSGHKKCVSGQNFARKHHLPLSTYIEIGRSVLTYFSTHILVLHFELHASIGSIVQSVGLYIEARIISPPWDSTWELKRCIGI